MADIEVKDVDSTYDDQAGGRAGSNEKLLGEGMKFNKDE